jgi:hypothetical protein
MADVLKKILKKAGHLVILLFECAIIAGFLLVLPVYVALLLPTAARSRLDWWADPREPRPGRRARWLAALFAWLAVWLAELFAHGFATAWLAVLVVRQIAG